MGYFDGLVNGSFKPMDDGSTLFYPNGMYGIGYIIPDVERAQKIRASIKRHTVVSFFLIIGSVYILFLSISAFSLPWWIAGIIYLLIVAGYTFVANRITKGLIEGLAPTGQKLSLAEVHQTSARSFGMPTLWMLTIVSCLMTFAAALLLTDGKMEWYFRLTGLVGLLLFGGGGVASGYFIWIKSRQESSKMEKAR